MNSTCRFPARLAALKAAQLLCFHKAHYADDVFPEGMDWPTSAMSGGFQPPERAR